MLHRGPEQPSEPASVPGPGPETELFGIGDAFMATLPESTRGAMLAEASSYDVLAGEALLGGPEARVGLIVQGLAREYLTAGDGRQVTVRYIHAGALIANLSGVRGARSPSRIEAVVRCRITELDAAALFRQLRTDAAVAVAMFAETSRWLEDAYITLAATAFGSMRERVARHLLERAGPDGVSGRLLAPVTQVELAEAIGSSREVVARVLRAFRVDGLIKTGNGSVELIDPGALSALVGRWQTTSRG